MSNRLLGLAWKTMPAGMGTPARLLYAWFCDRARDDDGDTTWATVKDMREATETSDSNTRAALAILRAHGLVVPLTPLRGRGRTQFHVLPSSPENRRITEIRPKTGGIPAEKSARKQAAISPENRRCVPIVPQFSTERENARANDAAPPPVASAALSQKGLMETFVRVLGRPPQAGRERGKWLYGVQHLHAEGVTPPEIPRLVDAYRAKYGPDIPCHPGTIHDHLPALRGATHAITQRASDTHQDVAAEKAKRLANFRAYADAGLYYELAPSARAELVAAGYTPPPAKDEA